MTPEEDRAIKACTESIVEDSISKIRGDLVKQLQEEIQFLTRLLILVAIVAVALMSVVAFIASSQTRKTIQEEAVLQGYADHVIVDRKTGRTEWRWKEKQ